MKTGNICAPFKQPGLMESPRDKEQGIERGRGRNDLIHLPLEYLRKQIK